MPATFRSATTTVPGQPVPVLHHDDGNGRVGQNPGQLPAVPVHPRPDLADHLRHHQATAGRARDHPPGLPLQIITLARRRHPAVRHHPPLARLRTVASHRPDGVCTTRTGIFPSRAHSHAVW